MSVAVRTAGEPCGPGEFAVPSRTFPGETWAVVWQTPELHFCGCPAHHRRQSCRHVQAVALAVEVEARQAIPLERRQLAAARLTEIEEMFSA